MKNKVAYSMKIIVILTTLIFYSSCSSNLQNTGDDVLAKSNKEIIDEITEANNQLYTGLNAMFTGDLDMLNNLWSHTEAITYMGPFGGSLKGWALVNEEFTKVAAMKLGGKISCKDLHVFAGTDVGYATCVEEGVNIGPDGDPVSVSHRATNIFHLEGGEWRLVHHHTDISTQLEEAYDKEAN